MEKEKKKKQENTPGLGIEYEVHVSAYFALLLNTNPEIEDFKLRSNVQDFGNLDDLLIDIKTKSGENLYFAFQLKHKEKSSKNLLPTNFEAKGNFNLKKSCESFKKLNEEHRRKYHFNLYTNENFNSTRTSEVENFCIKAMEDGHRFGKKFFHTSSDGKSLYKFEVKEETEAGENVKKKDYEKFFSKFSLYTGQADARDLQKFILDVLKDEICYGKYIDFFRRWHRGDFVDKILDKKTLNIHLIDILLSPDVAINHHLSDDKDGNSIFFETLVQQFDITIINDSKQNFIPQLEKNTREYKKQINKDTEKRIIQLAKDNKFIDRFTEELKEETKLKLLHYFHQKPLILDFNTNSKTLIYEASKLCKIQENGIKLVILGRDIDVSKFSHLKIFANLTGVHGYFLEEIKKRCKLSLQGRNISFGKIFDEEIQECFTPREIFQMLKGNFSIGEDKEKVPECYMPRAVSAKVFDIESIIRHSSGSVANIFYYDSKFEELEILIQNTVDREDYFCIYSRDAIVFKPTEFSNQLNKDIPTIILRKEECSRNQINQVHEEFGKKDVHLFKVIDAKRCLLLMSTKNISNNENYKFTKMSVEEKNIHVFFNNSINILCAQPGMGKSTLMKYLKNEYDPNFWTLKVDLRAHNHFLKKHHKIEDVLKYFLDVEKSSNEFSKHIKTGFSREKKVVFFLDGLDEVEVECVDYILNITRQLSEMGFRIWLSSRQNLQEKLEQYFNIVALEIDEINKNQQMKYIEERLASLYNQNEIEEIVEKIFSTTDLANNRKILEIPLQLHIITQIFLDERSYYNSLKEDSFILTKMFEIFFQGKYKHLLGNLKEKLEYYEIVALHSLLDDEHFQKLQIENFKLSQIKSREFQLDGLGIITEVNSANKAVFEHLSFAEYFASKYLVKNFAKARILKEEIFSDKYQNLFLMFNIMLAEDSPLYLSVIYKDFDRIEDMEESCKMDKGGRSLLQVVTCVATRHPVLRFHNSGEYVCLMEDRLMHQFKGEDLKIKEIVNRLLSSDPFKSDDIFEWNSLEYALATGALYVVEAILKKSEKRSYFYEILGKYYKDEVVAYYSIRFGYHRLLSEILAKNSCRVTNIVSDYLKGKGNNSILNFIFTSDCTNSTKIVEVLTDDDINKIVYEEDGYTFFHFAVFHKHTEIVKFLLRQKADVNAKDKKGISPLLESVDQNSYEISKLLIEEGADVNIKDMKGRPPLFLALHRGNLEISKLLVEKGADVNIEDKINGRSSLFLAVKRNNLEISKLLIEKGANFNMKDKAGWSPLFLAVKQNNFKISKLLVEKGADINIKDTNGASPLFLAVKKNNFKILKLLVENRADVNIKDKDGWSPLHWAVVQNNLEISKLLVEKGVDVNKSKDKEIFSAAKQSNSEISKLVINSGAESGADVTRGTSKIMYSNSKIVALKLSEEVGSRSQKTPKCRIPVRSPSPMPVGSSSQKTPKCRISVRSPNPMQVGSSSQKTPKCRISVRSPNPMPVGSSS